MSETSNPRFVLIDCAETILRELAVKETTQRDIAQTYLLAMESGEQIDWARVNRAIIERWSRAGLVRIKTMAHSGKCFA